MLPTTILEMARRLIKADEAEWWVRDLTESYPWLKSGSVYWIVDPDVGESHVLAEMPGGAAVRLNEPGGEKHISELVESSGASAGLLANGGIGLAQLLMEWRHDPRGYLLTPDFVTRKTAEVDDWLRGTATSASDLFSLCAPPQLSIDQAGRFSLRFAAIDHEGSTSTWEVGGSTQPFQIKSLKTVETSKPGTFYFPDEF